MKTVVVFLITKDDGKYLKTISDGFMIWADEIKEAKPFEMYQEASETIDRISHEGFYQIQKVFLRVN